MQVPITKMANARLRVRLREPDGGADVAIREIHFDSLKTEPIRGETRPSYAPGQREIVEDLTASLKPRSKKCLTDPVDIEWDLPEKDGVFVIEFDDTSLLQFHQKKIVWVAQVVTKT